MNRMRFYLSTPDSSTHIAMSRIGRVLQLLNVKAATIQHGVGLWEGKTELSYTVEILREATPGIWDEGERIADGLREAFGQDAVLLTIDRVMTYHEATKAGAA